MISMEEEKKSVERERAKGAQEKNIGKGKMSDVVLGKKVTTTRYNGPNSLQPTREGEGEKKKTERGQLWLTFEWRGKNPKM